MTPATTTAHLLGALRGAHALLTEAKAIAGERHGLQLEPLLGVLMGEIEATEETLAHDLNHQLAGLLPEGFAYSPE
jgi:hypothetical protein